MRTWTETCCGEPNGARLVEARGVKFCQFPYQPFVALLGRHSSRIDRGVRRGKETKTGFEVDAD
jgi:hypothetical protein